MDFPFPTKLNRQGGFNAGGRQMTNNFGPGQPRPDPFLAASHAANPLAPTLDLGRGGFGTNSNAGLTATQARLIQVAIAIMILGAEDACTVKNEFEVSSRKDRISTLDTFDVQGILKSNRSPIHAEYVLSFQNRGWGKLIWKTNNLSKEERTYHFAMDDDKLTVFFNDGSFMVGVIINNVVAFRLQQELGLPPTEVNMVIYRDQSNPMVQTIASLLTENAIERQQIPTPSVAYLDASWYTD